MACTSPDDVGAVLVNMPGVLNVTVQGVAKNGQSMQVFNVVTSGGAATTGDISALFSELSTAWAVVTSGSSNVLMRETAFALGGVTYSFSALAAAVVGLLPSASIADGTGVRITVIGTPV